MRVILSFLFLALLPFSAMGGEYRFHVDYFGHPVSFSCVVERAGSAEDFLELVELNRRECGPCLLALGREAGRMGIHGYARVLLYNKFVDGLGRNEYPSSRLVSLGDSVVGNRILSRDDRLALLFAMLEKGGFEAGLMESEEDGRFLTLRVDQKITGYWWGQKNRYAWEPGKPFHDWANKPKGDRARTLVYSEGEPLDFELPGLDWSRTGRGGKKDYRSPEGCPDSWTFSLQRRPRFEEYLALWPRDRHVMANNAHRMLGPFGVGDRLSLQNSGLGQEAFGNCLLRWEIENLGYVDVADRRAGKDTRNPAETLFLGGDCDELCYTLIGILRLAGFPSDNIRMLRWNEGHADSHMNLAVAPLSGDLSHGHFVEIGGRKYYIMDPAYTYRLNGKVATSWGMLSDEYKGKSTTFYKIE